MTPIETLTASVQKMKLKKSDKANLNKLIANALIEAASNPTLIL